MSGVISLKTIEMLYKAYREVETGKKLLSDIEKVRETARNSDRYAPTLCDAFGRQQHLQLGIPSGDNSHRLLDVSPILAESCIRAHIAQKQKEFLDANEIARVELSEVSE
jgi:hypothetical protein